MTNRVHIDAPAGIVEIEGEKDFVEGLLAKLFPLLEEAGFGSRPPSRGDTQIVQNGASDKSDEQQEVDVDGGGKPRVKRKRASTPKGHSCADRILSLKVDGFFKEQRSVGDIVSGLAQKGYTHNSNQVSAAGESLFNRNLIQRAKEGKGSFKYFWDRD